MFDPAEPVLDSIREPNRGPILGIDPGLSRCGYGAVRREAGAFIPVAYGVLRTEVGAPLPERLAALESDLSALINELAPDSVAVERVLFQANVRTAISVGQASGLALAVAGHAGIEVTHYSPNEVKLAVTGSGRADKPQVQAMVCQLLSLSEVPPPDAADALALALCHAWSATTHAVAASCPPGLGLDRAVAAAIKREARA